MLCVFFSSQVHYDHIPQDVFVLLRETDRCVRYEIFQKELLSGKSYNLNR